MTHRAWPLGSTRSLAAILNIPPEARRHARSLTRPESLAADAASRAA
jgi:hypothetical protein